MVPSVPSFENQYHSHPTSHLSSAVLEAKDRLAQFCHLSYIILQSTPDFFCWKGFVCWIFFAFFFSFQAPGQFLSLLSCLLSLVSKSHKSITSKNLKFSFYKNRQLLSLFSNLLTKEVCIELFICIFRCRDQWFDVQCKE